MRPHPPPYRWLAAVAICFLLVAAAWGGERNGSFLAAVESIQAEQLRRHVDYLAADRMEGREAGSRGGREAGEYVASRLAEAGLRGAGTDGGFYQPFPPNYRNVLALVEGSDPALRGEYVLVGAHYDHVGYGTRRNSRGPVGSIHNGADDNASGTAGLLELAEAFALLSPHPRRSILLIGWDAEEKGLLGSGYWSQHPTIPLGEVACNMTMDMIGSLRQDRLTVYGTRSGYGLRRLVSLSNRQENLKIVFPWKLIPNSDHYWFVQRNIPVLLFHTGLHDAYHTPRDDPERINAAGIQRVIRLVFGLVYDLANAPEVPRFRAAAWQEAHGGRRAAATPRADRPLRLGVSWSPRDPEGPGVRITKVFASSAAEAAGLQRGDRILRVGDREVRSAEDLRGAVALAGHDTLVVIERTDGRGRAERPVALPGKPLRLGIRWRIDEAEPQALILTDVVPGTPAARAGLERGDRIYRIDGRDFADDGQFAGWAQTLPGPLRVLVERDGQIRTVVIHIQRPAVDRAA